MNKSNKLLSDIVAFRTYAKYLPHKARRESLEETINRKMIMDLDKFGGLSKSLSKDIIKAYEKVHSLEVMPSMRGMQFAGEAVLKNNARQFNCSFTHIKDVESFGECLFLLLSGVGVGYSVQKRHVNQLPKVISPREEGRFIIHDSIQGWAQAVDVLFQSYFYGRIKPVFDFTAIRPKGSYLVTTGAKAPGPEPLKAMLSKVEQMLKNAKGRKLKPVEVHDIICIISDCVLAGGIRRCLPEDTLVFTTKGIKRIKDIKPGDLVYTRDSIKPVLNKFAQGTQKVTKIITNGQTVYATSNHKIATLTDDGEILFKPVKDLKVTDTLLQNNKLIEGGINELPETESHNLRPKGSTTAKTLPKLKLNTDFAWLVGLIQGNGYICDRRTSKGKEAGPHIAIAFNSCKEDLNIIEKTQKALDKLELSYKTKKVKTENAIKIIISNQALVEYFLDHVKKPKKPITVPNFILKADYEIRGAYLAGLVDSDGSIKNRPVSLVSTVYERFGEELVGLYSSLGISVRLNRKPRSNSNWKNITKVSLISNREGYNKFVGAYSAKGILQIKGRQCGFKVPLNLAKNELHKNSLFRKKCQLLKGYVNYDAYRELGGSLSMTPIEIKELIPDYKEVPTYDIEVQDQHEFFGDSVLTHNSALISLFDRDDEEMLKCKHGEWWVKHPHRARANNSAVLPRSEVTKEEFNYVYGITQGSGSGEPGFIWTNNLELGTNPCFTYDTPLLTKDGYIPIGSLNQKTNLKAINHKGQVIPLKVWSNGIKNIIEMKLTSGEIIKCTPDHVFMDNRGLEVEAKNMKGRRIKPFTKLNEVNTDFTKLGFMQGDGSLTRLNSKTNKGIEVHIGQNDKDIAQLFDIEYIEDKRAYYINEYNNILIDLKFDATTLSTRKFPETYDNWSNDQKYSFLRGMYSANGCVIKKHRVAYKAVSQDLINKLSEELSNFGINNYITTNKPKKVKFNNGEYTCSQSYELNISNFNSIKKFAELIGFVHNYKNEDLLNLIDLKSPMVVSVKNAGKEEVFDFNLDDDTHWGVVGSGFVAHNCGEISLNNHQFCNLTTINQTGLKDKKDFLSRVYSATLLGTMQAAYTDFPYLRSSWKETTELESLLGVSFTGIADAYGTVKADWLKEGAKLALEVNEKYAKKIGINPAARVTTIKPEGSSSCVLGSSSGVHARHAEYYLRRVRMNKDDALANYLSQTIPELVEVDLFSPTGIVVTIPQKSPDGAVTKSKETALTAFKRAMLYNRNWIKYGHRSGDNQHNVSCTISVRDDEWDDLKEEMWIHRELYSGISLLPFDGGNYQQAPFEDCDKETYDKYMNLLTEIDLKKVREEQDNTNKMESIACGGGACEII